jgi:hypothetical protein
MTGERPMRVEKQTDTARAPPWLHRVRVLLAQNTQLGLCDGIGRGTLELGPWSCSQSHVVVPFYFLFTFICKNKSSNKKSQTLTYIAYLKIEMDGGIHLFRFTW